MNERIPLIPKNPGGPLRVIAIGRISTIHQDLESIDAGHRDVREHLARVYQGPIHVQELGGQGSGMRTDRNSIVQAEELIATATWDLVIAPDLGRIYRNPRHLYAFVQDAVDHDTRVIALAENFDTADPGWHLGMGIASIQHGMTIPDTQRRVRSKARDQFHKGRMVLKYRYGYRKLTADEAAAGGGPPGLLLARRPECTATIGEMRRRVMAGDPYRAVADWLNAQGVEPGPYSESGAWIGRQVKDLLGDPILGGKRTFANVLSATIFKSGKKRRRKNPDGPEAEHYAELAHMSEAEQAEVVAFMALRAKPNRHAVGHDHPLYNKPRDRAIWPAQHPRCGVCGALMYRYDRADLKCRACFVPSKRAKKKEGDAAPRCWNHLHVDCREIRSRVIERVMAHCDEVAGFREALVDAAWRELEAEAVRSGRLGRSEGEEVAELERRGGRIAEAIAKGGRMEALVGQLTEVDGQLQAARDRLAARQARETKPGLQSREDVDRDLDGALEVVAARSFEFAALMRRVIPQFTIVPVQALDTGLVRPRGKLVFRPAALLGDGGRLPSDSDGSGARDGDVAMTIDLFKPPAHVQAIGACLEARRTLAKPSHAKIAARTGIHRMTVKRALGYARLMEAEKLDDPYRELAEKPTSASRWRDRGAR